MLPAASTPCQVVSRKCERTVLVDFVKRCLSREERIVLTLHYCEELSLHEIALVLDRPFAYVHRLHAQTLERVQQQFRPAAGGQVLVA